MNTFELAEKMAEAARLLDRKAWQEAQGALKKALSESPEMGEKELAEKIGVSEEYARRLIMAQKMRHSRNGKLHEVGKEGESGNKEEEALLSIEEEPLLSKEEEGQMSALLGKILAALEGSVPDALRRGRGRLFGSEASGRPGPERRREGPCSRFRDDERRGGESAGAQACAKREGGGCTASQEECEGRLPRGGHSEGSAQRSGRGHGFRKGGGAAQGRGFR
jgi:hypothetical protein